MQAELERPRPFQQLLRLALGQHGVVSSQQASILGVDSRALNRAVKAGKLTKSHRGIYRVSGAQESWRSDLMAAHLWLGDDSAASHLSAASLWQLPGFPEGPIEFSTPRNRKSVPPVVVHKLCVDLNSHTTNVGSVPVTNSGRTLVDLAGRVPNDQLECAIEDALRRRLTSVAHLRFLSHGRYGKGARGVSSLRKLLDDKRTITASQFEMKLFQALRMARLPQPTRQHEVLDGDRFVARVDFAYPWAMVAIEADSYRFHSGREAWESDLVRRSDLTALGWLVIHVTYRQLQSQMDEVVARIKQAISPRLLP